MKDIGRKGYDIPVFVDHISNSESVVDDLAPSVAIEELRAQLAGRQVPRAAVGVGGIFEQSGELLALAQEFLQSEQVTVDTLTIAGHGGVLRVSGKGCAEEAHDLLAGDRGVGLGLAKSHALVRDATDGLGTALLELAGRGRLVCGAVLAVHLEVRQLDDHLHISVGAALELLDETLAVSLVRLHLELVSGHLLAVLLGGRVDGLEHLRVQMELDGAGIGQVGAHRLLGEVDLVVENEVVEVIVEAVGGAAVHHAVLTHETSSAVVIDDELQGLVEPAVHAIAVPVLVSPLLQGHGGGVVEADDKAAGLDVAQSLLVRGAGCQQLLPSIGPQVTVGDSQNADGGSPLRNLIDALKLLLQLGDVETLPVDNKGHLEELVLAHNHNVLVFLGRVLLGVVGALGGNTAAVEHVLVRAHGDGQLAHVLGLQGAIVYLALELERSGSDRGRTLDGVPPGAIVPV